MNFKLKYFAAFLIVAICVANNMAFGQDVTPLLKKIKSKLDLVNDYSAKGLMKTDVSFIKAPPGEVNILYRKPDKFKLQRNNGISLLPKGGVSINLSRMLGTNDFTAIASGENVVGGTKVKVVKLLPIADNSELVLTTLYIDEANLLILKTATTTKDNGTYEMEFSYGKFARFGLPDKVIFSFLTKDFKLPKGLTMEFETGEKKTEADKIKSSRGRIEITYTSYTINKGIPDAAFN